MSMEEEEQVIPYQRQTKVLQTFKKEIKLSFDLFLNKLNDYIETLRISGEDKIDVFEDTEGIVEPWYPPTSIEAMLCSLTLKHNMELIHSNFEFLKAYMNEEIEYQNHKDDHV